VARLEEARGRGELGVYRQELLARLLLDRGDQEGARRELEELLRMAPDNVRAKNDLAYLLADSGQDMERALRLAEEAMESAGQAPLIEDTLGYVYLKRGLLEPALRHFEHAGLVAKRMGVERPVIAYHRGLTLARMGRTEEARRAFEEALALDEDFAEARQALEGLGAGGSS
jgi:tetratricopeptide (TPR) repeat protein